MMQMHLLSFCQKKEYPSLYLSKNHCQANHRGVYRISNDAWLTTSGAVINLFQIVHPHLFKSNANRKIKRRRLAPANKSRSRGLAAVLCLLADVQGTEARNPAQESYKLK